MKGHIATEIKVAAYICLSLGIIVSCFWGIKTMVKGEEAIGFINLVIGSVLSWVNFIALYGLAVLVEKTTKMADRDEERFCAQAENEALEENKKIYELIAKLQAQRSADADGFENIKSENAHQDI